MSDRALREFQYHPGSSVSDQLTVFVRGLIQSGRLAVGQRLPSSQELARLWKTQAARVHAALSVLVKEGLLDRVQRRGTFVRPVPRKLQTLGIYLYRDVWHDAHAFARALCRGLEKEAAERAIGVSYFIDVRRVEEQIHPWAPLVSACQRGEIQAVVAPQSSFRHEKWFGSLPVPLALYGRSELPCWVEYDFRHFIDKGMVELARQGCRKMGFICAARLHNFLRETAKERQLLSGFAAKASAMGLQLNSRHVLMPRGYVDDGQARTYGRRCLEQLWRLPERPDGLLVYSDIAAQGVLAAASRLRIGIPEQLRLVLHRNEGIPLDCTVQASFLETSPAQVARAMVDLVVRQFHGQKCYPVLLGLSVVTGS